MKYSKLSDFLPIDKLTALAEENKASYAAALPFAHSVFDDVFNESVLSDIIAEFEQVDSGWREFESKYEKKLQMNKDANLPPVTRAFIHNLNSGPFIEFLEELTGIQGLIPDPHLDGGGLHKTVRGGKLGIHVDFNENKRMNVYRRLNVIIYLNKDWLDSYGGHFELWDEDRNGCVKKLLPIFNRMAIFSTTNTSFHGLPEPLTCPEDRSRLSLALYYYTAKNRGGQIKKSHSTVFLDEKGKREELSTKKSFTGKVVGKLRRMLAKK